jgi:hypothetical protein
MRIPRQPKTSEANRFRGTNTTRRTTNAVSHLTAGGPLDQMERSHADTAIVMTEISAGPNDSTLYSADTEGSPTDQTAPHHKRSIATGNVHKANDKVSDRRRLACRSLRRQVAHIAITVGPRADLTLYVS